MWKSHFIVAGKGIIFHSPCGNRCGNHLMIVEKKSFDKVFHISTGPYFKGPVEMWKTQS
jgi:hypothetical protein